MQKGKVHKSFARESCCFSRNNF